MTTAIATRESVDVDSLDTAKPLEEIFQPFGATLAKWQEKAASLVVTDINQKTEMQQARLARLELKEARVAMDKTRKSLTEGLKARTTRIDTFARTIREKMEALEASLLESEQFAERHAAKLKAELKAKREQEIQPFLDRPVFGDLSDLPEAAYAEMLADARILHQAKLDAAAKAEAERKAKEEAEKLERQRLAEENARLSREREEAEKKAAAERVRLEKEQQEQLRKIEAERAEERRKAKEATDRAAKEAAEMRAKLEAKAREEAAAKAKEEAERKARAKAERDAANATDKAKIDALLFAIRNFDTPSLANKTIQNAIEDQFVALEKFVELQIQAL